MNIYTKFEQKNIYPSIKKKDKKAKRKKEPKT